MNYDEGDVQLALSRLLSNVPLMNDYGRASDVLGLMATKKFRLAVERSDEVRTDCLRIIKACLDQRGALACMASLLRELDGTVQTEAFVEEAARFLPSDIFSLKERIDYLAAILPLTEGPEFALLYRRATGQVAPRSFNDLDDFIREFEEMIYGDDTHPLVVLTHGLMQEASMAGVQLTIDWAEQIARNIDGQRRDNLAFQQQKLARLRQRKSVATKAGAERSTLVLQLDAKPPKPDCYRFTGWLYVGQTFVDKVYGSDDAITLEKAKEAVRDVIAATIGRLGAIDSNLYELDVEFAVPRKLLNHPFETWVSGVDDYMSLGAQYVVVVRDLVRQRDPTMAWRRKWHDVQTGAVGGENDLSDWITCKTSPLSRGSLYNLLLANKYVSLGITFPPTEEFASAELAEALNAGLPIVIWPRRSCHHRNDGARSDTAECLGLRFEKDFKKLMAGKSIFALPDLVREFRRAAAGSDSGPEISLLWDIPTRCPEADFILAVPPALGDSHEW